MGSPQLEITETDGALYIRQVEGEVKKDKVYVSEIKNVFISNIEISKENPRASVSGLNTIQNLYLEEEPVLRNQTKPKRSNSRYSRHSVELIKQRYEQKCNENNENRSSIERVDVSSKKNEELTVATNLSIESTADFNSIEKTSANIEFLQKQLKTQLPKEVVEIIRNSPDISRRTSLSKQQKKVQFSPDVVFEKPVPPPRRSLTIPKEPENILDEIDHKGDIVDIQVLKVKYLNSFEFPERKEVVPPEEPEKLPDNTSPNRIKVVEVPEEPIEAKEIELTYSNVIFSEPEPRHIIERASSSDDSILEIHDVLSDFVMDNKSKEKKEKKRSSSFRKIFTGGLFSKDKKKDKEKTKDHKIPKKTDNNVFSDNAQNESNFNRALPYRHTIDSHSRNDNQKNKTTQRRKSIQNESEVDEEFEKIFAEQHKSKFNQIKTQFSYPDSEYVRMNSAAPNDASKTAYMNVASVEKYIDTSSSSNTIESEVRNDNYDALLLQAEFQRQQNNLSKNSSKKHSNEYNDDSRTSSKYTDTPPRAHDTHQNVQLIKPKAIIPINSERPLPNPYQNDDKNSEVEKTTKTLDRNLNISEKKDCSTKTRVRTPENEKRSNQDNSVDGVYGTVYDLKPAPAHIVISRAKTLEAASANQSQSSSSVEASSISSSPKSPSVERSKLRLPPNREKVELQPRIKSPIPQTKISTDKIIATELLKPKSEKENKLTSPSHQRLEIDIDYPNSPENYTFTPVRVEENRRIQNRPPPLEIRSENSSDVESQRSACVAQHLEAAEWCRKQNELSKMSPIVVPPNPQIVTNATVHVDSQHVPPSNLNMRSRSTMHIHSTSPNHQLISSLNRAKRASTPLSILSSSLSLQSSPKKEEIRQHVEAYFWKELKKMKEQEDFDLYQVHLSRYGYAEDPIVIRRGRSASNGSRSSKRSSSLPRESRHERKRDIIPEHKAYVYRERIPLDPIYDQRQNFARGSPQIRTLDSYENGDVRPIFRRGSLTYNNVPATQQQNYKKVSFSSQNADAFRWPTKNGFTGSPPQRRIDFARECDDEVFLPTSAQANMIYQRNPTQIDRAQLELEIAKESPYGSRPPVPPGYRSRHPGNPGNVQNYTRNPPDNQRRIVNENKIQNDILVRSNQQRLQGSTEYGFPQQYQAESPYGFVNRSTQEVIVESKKESPYVSRRHSSLNRSESSRQSRENYNAVPPNKMQYDQQQSEQYAHCASRQNPYISRQVSAREANVPQGRQEPLYGSRQIIPESPYASRHILQNNNESPYGSRQSFSTNQSRNEPIYNQNYPTYGRRQTTVSNKVCDIYGKIHDTNQQITSPNQIHQTGVLYGQLNSSRSPLMTHQSYNQIPNNFVRGNRLTSSANDMYKRLENHPRYRYEDISDMEAPTRPLPPVPAEGKTKFLMTRRANQRAQSDIDSNSEIYERASQPQRKPRRVLGK